MCGCHPSSNWSNRRQPLQQNAALPNLLVNPFHSEHNWVFQFMQSNESQNNFWNWMLPKNNKQSWPQTLLCVKNSKMCIWKIFCLWIQPMQALKLKNQKCDSLKFWIGFVQHSKILLVQIRILLLWKAWKIQILHCNLKCMLEKLLANSQIFWAATIEIGHLQTDIGNPNLWFTQFENVNDDSERCMRCIKSHIKIQSRKM